MSSSLMRARADRLRAIALEAVLELSGARQDRGDRAKWHTTRGVLSVNGARFMNWSQGQGGGGAIDLAIHLNGMDFKAALQWLADHFGPVASSESSPAPRSRLELPGREHRNLPAVRRYLVQERGLPSSLLEPLIASGSIYADPRANAVFLLREETGRPVGAEVRGTSSIAWRGMARGSRKDLGCFSVLAEPLRSIVLCESAVDALSFLALHPQTLAVSTAGARPNPSWLARLTQAGPPVYCGFDADPTGDDMASAMINLHPQIARLRPPLKDWNDVLRSRS